MRIGNFFEFPIKYFEKLSKNPPIIFPLYLKILGKLNKKWSNNFDIEKYMYVNSIRDESPDFSNELPKIEILIVAKPDDLDLLEKNVKYSVLASKNPISMITILVPEKYLFITSKFKSIEDEIKVKIQIKCELEYVTEKEISMIRQYKLSRFGWILQQILVVRYVLNSTAKGVLVIDADTILVRSRVWVDNLSNQILIPTQEFHKPYYDFLLLLSDVYSNCNISFVSHHMLMQPLILKEIYETLDLSVGELLHDALNYAKRINSESPFDLKYEPYAQYLFRKHQNKVKLAKWANLSISRKNLQNIDMKIEKIKYSYSSISVHHWNT